MQLQPHDLHLIFDDDANHIKGYDHTGTVIFKAEARNRAVNTGFEHYGRCPRGEFLLGAPHHKHDPAFGRWFTPILDYANHHAMRDFAREGIGVHGGGSALPDPFAPRQGWYQTHGCVRLQNEDNDRFAGTVHAAQSLGGKCYLTVIGE